MNILFVYFNFATNFWICHYVERMSQKSTEQLCVDDVVEIDELKNEWPWSNKSETLFVDLMDEEVAKGNRKINASTGYKNYNIYKN